MVYLNIISSVTRIHWQIKVRKNTLRLLKSEHLSLLFSQSWMPILCGILQEAAGGEMLNLNVEQSFRGSVVQQFPQY